MYFNQLCDGFCIDLDTREDHIIIDGDNEIWIVGLQWEDFHDNFI